MDVLEVDRVVIATWELEESIERFNNLLGVTFAGLMEPTTTTEGGPQQVANVISDTGLELVTPRGEENEVSRFLEENGPGLYAVSMQVTDLAEAKAELAEKDLQPVGEYAQGTFEEVFYHPRHFGGAMLVLTEYDAPHPAVSAANQ